MTAFRNDLSGSLDAAHEICGLLTDYDPTRKILKGLHRWQGEAFEAIQYEGGIERIEDQLNAIAEQDTDSKTAVGLLKAEVRETYSLLTEIVATWEKWKNNKEQRREIETNERNSRNNREQRNLSSVKNQSKYGLGTLKIVLTSLIAILAELFPGLKAILEAVKEGVEHFTT